MSYWSEIVNNHEETDFNIAEDGAVSKIIYIDAWRPGCDQGAVIATVILTESGDVCIIYRDNIARTNAYAQEVIRTTVAKIKEAA